ncbi:diaminohydroxyphosphoribosylaminopyrimidine deaminase / 5-amino-6-(5-phosphoribosylamino)uracil reductase [Azospirillaceae bacterium]
MRCCLQIRIRVFPALESLVLRAAGIQVSVGVLANEARAQSGVFLACCASANDHAKLATSLDGRIATHAGHSQWITGPVARAWGHALRAQHDAIMVGSGTAIADDPDLTCRLPGMAHRSPVRIVVDSRLRTPLTGRLIRSARETPTWIITRADGDSSRKRVFLDCGVELIPTPVDAEGRLDLDVACRSLAERGLTRVLVEGGSHLAASVVRRGLVDRLEWFRAARLIGGDGAPALVGFGVERLDQTIDFVCVATRQAGEDRVESYTRRIETLCMS